MNIFAFLLIAICFVCITIVKLCRINMEKEKNFFNGDTDKETKEKLKHAETNIANLLTRVRNLENTVHGTTEYVKNGEKNKL